MRILPCYFHHKQLRFNFHKVLVKNKQNKKIRFSTSWLCSYLFYLLLAFCWCPQQSALVVKQSRQKRQRCLSSPLSERPVTVGQDRQECTWYQWPPTPHRRSRGPGRQTEDWGATEGDPWQVNASLHATSQFTTSQFTGLPSLTCPAHMHLPRCVGRCMCVWVCVCVCVCPCL